MRFAAVSLAGAVVGGLIAVDPGPTGSVTIGASGLVFTYFGWLITRAVRERSFLAIAIGVVALVLTRSGWTSEGRQVDLARDDCA